MFDGDGYVIVREKFRIEGTESSIYQYDLENDSWTFVATIPEETIRLADPFVIGNNVFFVGHYIVSCPGI